MSLAHPLKELFSSWLNQAGLVTRQEFDIQTQVLIKTRAKVEQLEKEVQRLINAL